MVEGLGSTRRIEMNSPVVPDSFEEEEEQKRESKKEKPDVGQYA